MREQFLTTLDPKALLSLEQLNERLWHWLDTVYHRREHSSLHWSFYIFSCSSRLDQDGIGYL